MKKYLIVLLTILLIAGCSNQKKPTMLEIENGASKSVMELESKGDKIIKITQTLIININGMTDQSIEQIKDHMQLAKETYSQIEGVQYSSEISEKEVLQKVVADVERVETLQILIDQGLLPVIGENVGSLSLKGTIEQLQDAGWVLK